MILFRRCTAQRFSSSGISLPGLLRHVLSFSLLACFAVGDALGGNPSLEVITPSVGTRGESFTVVAKGASLSNIRSVVFYEPGIRCERVESAKDDQATLHLVADSRCSLGPHAFRLLGDDGFSELRTVTISPFPTVQEDKEAKTQLIDLNRTIVGTLESDDVDTYQIQVKAGERISAEAVGVRLGISLLDTTLTLRDPSGQIIKRVDDTPMLNQDPAFSVVASTDGMYSIEITTAGANADADSQYALHVGNFPRPYSIFPLGVQAGSQAEIKFTLSDVNPNDTLTKQLKFDSGLLGTRFVELKDGDLICPSPIPFRINTCEQVSLETELPKLEIGSGVAPSKDAVKRLPLVAPIAVHGVIREPNEIDSFDFSVHENGTYSLEVFASRLGSLLDAVVEVQDQEGQVVSSGDDFDSHDTRLVFDLAANAHYTVSIRDKRKNFGAAYCYCLELVPLERSIVAFLPRRNKLSQTGQTIAIPKNNRSLAFMGIRRDRLEGSVTMSFEGLPSGVVVDSPSVSDSAFVVPVVFTATGATPTTGSMVAVNAALKSSDSNSLLSGGFEQVVDLVGGPADAIFQANTVDRLAVATVNAVPFAIELEAPRSPLSADGTLDVTVRVQRASGFDAPIDITLPLLPDWVDCPAKTRIPANSDFGTITLRAGRDAKAGSWPLVAEGVAGLAESSSNASPGGAGMGMRSRRQSPVSLSSVCTSLHWLSLCDSPARGNIDSISAERGSEVEIMCHLELSDSMPEQLVANLEDLPNRVQADPVQLQRGDKTIRFKLKIGDDAPIGTFDSVACRLSGTLGSQNVSYFVARNTKLIIAAPGASQKDESGRPLSPLDALRLRRKK